jgi:hypothetical protein
MKSFFINLVVAACALHEGAAFSTPPPSRRVIGRQTSLTAATVGSGNALGKNDPAVKPLRNPTDHELREMETIRNELVQKYIAMGHSEDYAAQEVNYFLEDYERSNEYVQMRRIAMARGNDLGIEDFVQFAAAFTVGVLASWALNFHAMNPDGGLPWIS